MSHCLAAFVFTATLALGADVCRDLPDMDPRGHWDPQAAQKGALEVNPLGASYTLEAPTKPQSFRLSVRPGGPAFRITISSHLTQSLGEPVRAGDIEVARCDDGKRLQLLPVMSAQPIDFAATYHAYDINFDGYLDLAVLVDFGSKFGSESWWVYDPESGKFVHNSLTEALRGLMTNGYHIDAEKHEIVSGSIMAGCPSMTTRYRIESDRLIVTHSEAGKQVMAESADDKAGVTCRVTVSDLIGGTMHVTAVRRYADGELLK